MFSTIDREVLIVFGSLLLLLSKNYDRDTETKLGGHIRRRTAYRGGNYDGEKATPIPHCRPPPKRPVAATYYNTAPSPA